MKSIIYLLCLLFFENVFNVRCLFSAAHSSRERAGTLVMGQHNGALHILLGHDRNLNKDLPASGGMEPGDSDCFDTMRRETLEETGGAVNLSKSQCQNLPCLRSNEKRITLGVVYNPQLTLAYLNSKVRDAINNRNLPCSWKEVDRFSAISTNEFLRVMYILHQYIQQRQALPNVQRLYVVADIVRHLGANLAYNRGPVHGGGLVIKFRDFQGNICEMDGHYAWAIAENYNALYAALNNPVCTVFGPAAVPMPAAVPIIPAAINTSMIVPSKKRNKRALLKKRKFFLQYGKSGKKRKNLSLKKRALHLQLKKRKKSTLLKKRMSSLKLKKRKKRGLLKKKIRI